MSKTLIGVGCSHTSGCACVVGVGTDKQEYELASKELKEKYGKETVSTKWITENFSWIGQLGNLLGVDKKLNFGFGGKGVEQCVLALRNYSFWKKDLSNHIIVFQIPSLWRIDVLNKKKNGYWLSPSTGLIHNDEVIDFFDKYYDKNFYQYKFVYELYFIQEYLKSLGAKVFFIDIFCPSLNDGIPTDKDHSKIIFDTSNLKPNWESDITQVIDYEVLIENLNILKLGPLKLNRLSDENLLDDNHFSESGNKELAHAIYNQIKDE